MKNLRTELYCLMNILKHVMYFICKKKIDIIPPTFFKTFILILHCWCLMYSFESGNEKDPLHLTIMVVRQKQFSSPTLTYGDTVLLFFQNCKTLRENILFHRKIIFDALGIEIWLGCSGHCFQKDYKCVMNCMYLSIDL